MFFGKGIAYAILPNVEYCPAIPKEPVIIITQKTASNISVFIAKIIHFELFLAGEKYHRNFRQASQ